MNIVNSLWVEKYRPQTLEDLVLPADYKVKFEEYFRTKDVPSLLLHGPPGTGKSSIARILTSKNGIISDRKSNVLVLNGSSKSTRGIDFVANVIEPYLKNPVTGKDKLKIVFIDEAYADFADDNCTGLVPEFQNIIVTRTLSKSYSLAGVRLGYAIAPEKLIRGMMKVKE